MKKVIVLYTGFQVSFSLLFWLPIFYEYQKRIGLNDQQIFSIQSIYYAAFCLLEIPTGLMADRWGRLRCLRSGAFILVVSNLLPIFWTHYLGFLAHFITLGLARSLISGASSAYLYDRLNVGGRAAEFKTIEGRARAYGLASKVIVWPAMGWVMQKVISLPYWLTAGAAAASLVFAFLLPSDEDCVGEKEKIQQSMGLKEFSAILRQGPWLALVMLQGISVFVLSRIIQVNLFQPLLTIKTFGIDSFGWIMSLMTIFEALGSFCPQFLRRWGGDLQWVSILTGMSALSLIGLISAGKAGTVILLCLFSLAVGLCYPVQRQLFNDSVSNPNFRATWMSVESILDRAVCAWVASMLGSAITNGQMGSFLMVSGMISLFGIILLHAAARVVLYKTDSASVRLSTQSLTDYEENWNASKQ